MEVKNVNDNVPLTKAPVYYPRISEDAAPNTAVIQLEASDADLSDTRITYKITAGNPKSLFAIASNTGKCREYALTAINYFVLFDGQNY